MRLRLTAVAAAIAVDFLKFGENALDVVQGMRSLGVPGQLDAAPRGIGFRRRRAVVGYWLGIHSDQCSRGRERVVSRRDSRFGFAATRRKERLAAPGLEC